MVHLPMLETFGRLHLLLLHLPIGFLLLASLLAARLHWKKSTDHRSALDFTVLCGAVVAWMSAGCGWLLAREGDYEPSLLAWHRWLGVGAAALAVMTWLLRRSQWYYTAIFMTAAVVGIAGHFGGSLTHGEGYLWEVFSKNKAGAQAPTSPSTAGATAFTALIQPVLVKKCASCHNPAKRKGKLLLDTQAGLLAGGEHGPVFRPGEPDSSELLRRARLPLHHDDHMPPSGRPQLTEEEIALLTQWIALGADFNAPVSALQPVGAPALPSVTFPPVQIEKAKSSDLDLLRKERIAFMGFGTDAPWMAVSVAGRKDLSPEKLSLLRAVKDQVIHLDCSQSNLDDPLLALLKDLPNLTRLNLSGTAISAEGLKNLPAWAYLEQINLSSTQVGDEAADWLGRLPALRSIFLWNSRFQPDALQRLRAQLPQVQIDAGAPADTAAAPLQLRPPKILFARNIFDDTVRVALDFPFKAVGLYYTIGAASPTTQSVRYTGEPLVFNESTTVHAIAAKDGWANSPVVTASFVKSKWKPKAVTLMSPPSTKYPGSGAASLTDGRIGETISDKSFLGYEGAHLTAVLDFGEMIDCHRVSVHYAENNGSWVFAPHGLEVWTSNDGQRWQSGFHTRYPTPGAMQEEKAAVLSEALPTAVKTRYLKVRVENLLKNPVWHAGAGQKCWVFVDEILVE